MKKDASIWRGSGTWLTVCVLSLSLFKVTTLHTCSRGMAIVMITCLSGLDGRPSGFRTWVNGEE